MGRHGTGGSEDAREEGDTSAFWGPQDQQADSFWGPSDGKQADEPTEEKESEPAKSPTPTATYSAREPRRTASPTPKPKPTKTKQTQEPVDEPIDEATAEESIPEETPTEEISLDPDRATRPDNGGIPLPTASETFQGVPSGGSVNVNFNVTSQRLTSYTATMGVTNASDQALSTFTLSLPVRGKILSVEGATWTQDGNLLIVDLSTPIAEGESTEVTIAATGRAGQPTNCGLVGGDCAVS